MVQGAAFSSQSTTSGGARINGRWQYVEVSSDHRFSFYHDVEKAPDVSQAEPSCSHGEMGITTPRHQKTAVTIHRGVRGMTQVESTVHDIQVISMLLLIKVSIYPSLYRPASVSYLEPRVIYEIVQTSVHLFPR